MYVFEVKAATACFDLKWNEAWSARAQSTRKGVNWRSKDVLPVQQQKPELPALTHLACK